MINKLRFWLFRRRYRKWSSTIKSPIIQSRTPFMGGLSQEDYEIRMRRRQMLLIELQSNMSRSSLRQQLGISSTGILGSFDGSLGSIFGSRQQN